jgi:hypothetical protein
MSASLGPRTSQSNKQFPLDVDDPAAAKKMATQFARMAIETN